MSIWWSLHLRREAASVPLARRLLVGAMETAGVDPDVSYDLSLALSEACANAVEHGGDASTADYRVTAFIDGDTCRIEVTDSGPGLPRGRHARALATHSARAPQPACQAPTHQARQSVTSRDTPLAEHGRGLFLIEELTDRVRFRDRPGRDGTVVTFDKILKWRDDAPFMAS
ncbi:ATP-binding protein [Streptomyces sp. AC536]|uniref:ATP-binding protein n=1 Tax=Streptomyces buecherae TaxID=2763006 RepID=UPI00164D4A92|nr:ATP-binding protein [Streptomyces buecherae]MBC3984980.1 ATP-binding protein [Streptomyces buecherae]QNJ41297.1 ATP-binding protein [Streptomyces buecherae]